jgi:hypothetical protein
MIPASSSWKSVFYSSICYPDFKLLLLSLSATTLLVPSSSLIIIIPRRFPHPLFINFHLTPILWIMVLLLILLIPNEFLHFLTITILPIIIILPVVILFIPPTIIRVHHLMTKVPLIILGGLTILPIIYSQLILL